MALQEPRLNVVAEDPNGERDRSRSGSRGAGRKRVALDVDPESYIDKTLTAKMNVFLTSTVRTVTILEKIKRSTLAGPVIEEPKVENHAGSVDFVYHGEEKSCEELVGTLDKCLNLFQDETELEGLTSALMKMFFYAGQGSRGLSDLNCFPLHNLQLDDRMIERLRTKIETQVKAVTGSKMANKTFDLAGFDKIVNAIFSSDDPDLKHYTRQLRGLLAPDYLAGPVDVLQVEDGGSISVLEDAPLRALPPPPEAAERLRVLAPPEAAALVANAAGGGADIAAADVLGEAVVQNGYRIGDYVEYMSPTHGRWIPAYVTSCEGTRIQVDCKPGTWLEPRPDLIRRREVPHNAVVVRQQALQPQAVHAATVVANHAAFLSGLLPASGRWLGIRHASRGNGAITLLPPRDRPAPY